MRVIDILDKIANKEEVPEAIKICEKDGFFDESYWRLTEREPSCYYRDIDGTDEPQYLFEYLTTDMLDCEVKIIEQNTRAKRLYDKCMRLQRKIDQAATLLETNYISGINYNENTTKSDIVQAITTKDKLAIDILRGEY